MYITCEHITRAGCLLVILNTCFFIFINFKCILFMHLERKIIQGTIFRYQVRNYEQLQLEKYLVELIKKNRRQKQ